MHLQVSGASEVAAPHERVWQRLTDLAFVAQSAPGVESVEALDETRYRVLCGVGVGALKLHLTLDVELFDLVQPTSAKLRAHGNAPGSIIDVESALTLQALEPQRTRLAWSAESEVSGLVASLGSRLVESAARMLTEQFWVNFARRVSEDEEA